MTELMSSTPAPGSVVVSLRDVSRSFHSTVALDGFDLDLHAGEFVSLLGPSGCGKSTALRIVAGLIPPSRGTVAWASEEGPAAERIGFVFQEPTLMPWATVEENVRLPLKLVGDSRKESAPLVHKAIDRVGLTDFSAYYPRELSGGMRMRASLARALVAEPKLLLLDEPFAALDEITRFRLNNDLLALWQQLRKTVLFVTHSVFESVYLSQRILVMTQRPGRVFKELAIDAPYPRTEAFRTSAEYAALCRMVSQTLAEVI
jgi:NitT/TauT family transport system ATP-binding protein